MSEKIRLTLPRFEFKESLGTLKNKAIEIKKYIQANPYATEKIRRDISLWEDFVDDLFASSFTVNPNKFTTNYQSSKDSSIHKPGILGSSIHHDAYIDRKIWILDELIDRIDLMAETDKINSDKPIQTKKELDTSNKKVFVVHGHNEEVRLAVESMIRKLKLDPIILQEQAFGGLTIIENFEKHSDVGFAIVLLTDDDIGKGKNEENYKKRARQNVILELGYFIGTLTRSRVLTLISENVESPSDLNGLLSHRIDAGGSWKFKIVKELKNAGYEVDSNDIL